MQPVSLAELESQFAALREETQQALAAASTPADLEAVRVKYLGRKSVVTDTLKQISQWPAEERGAVGKAANVFKASLEADLKSHQDALAAQPRAAASIDVTLPGAAPQLGRLHPVTQTMAEIVELFRALGFEIVEGPELELEWNNFDALNIPRDHPSRENFDTFFVDAPSPDPKKGQPLLRSHTSPVQIRVMQARRPPLRIVVPGKVYRPDPLDASHSFMFHQVEGLMVDDHTNFSDLKGLLGRFARQYFGPATKTRFRPHFFPFTEPSAEVDVSCSRCAGEGCSTCGQKGWLEILGCGMVHPNVFKAVGYDPKTVQGFAFGMGVERIAMLRHGISDIRLFFENDLRFLEQF